MLTCQSQGSRFYYRRRCLLLAVREMTLFYFLKRYPSRSGAGVSQFESILLQLVKKTCIHPSVEVLESKSYNTQRLKGVCPYRSMRTVSTRGGRSECLLSSLKRRDPSYSGGLEVPRGVGGGVESLRSACLRSPTPLTSFVDLSLRCFPLPHPPWSSCPTYWSDFI